MDNTSRDVGANFGLSSSCIDARTSPRVLGLLLPFVRFQRMVWFGSANLFVFSTVPFGAHPSVESISRTSRLELSLGNPVYNSSPILAHQALADGQ